MLSSSSYICPFQFGISGQFLGQLSGQYLFLLNRAPAVPSCSPTATTTYADLDVLSRAIGLRKMLGVLARDAIQYSLEKYHEKCHEVQGYSYDQIWLGGLRFGMLHQRAWAVGSHSSGPPAGGTPQI